MRFNRFIRIIGKEEFEKLRHKCVVIFGLGGVGGYIAEAIARSGIERIIICDYDFIEETNINRQIIATTKTTGLLKTDVTKKRIMDINPKARVLSYSVKANQKTIEEIVNLKPDFVCDAIDDLEAKISLIEYAIKKDVPFISSMGFANKMHPEEINISTLDKTSVCPLAKSLRKRLREKNITLNFPVVYSKETVIKTNKDGILGSSPYVPSTAGLLMASYVVNHMIGN